MSRILVTGAGGFVGQALLEHLQAGGVHGVVPAHRADLERCADAGFAAELLSGIEVVVHLANIAHRRAGADLLQRVNVEATRRLAEAAARSGARRFIYVSSVKAMGERSTTAALDEDCLEKPTTDYGRSKLAAEQALANVGRHAGMRYLALRPPLVYGPGVKANFLTLIRAIDGGLPLPFSGIANARSLIGVRNLVSAIEATLTATDASWDRSYVVADDEALSTPELCRAIGRALGRPARLFRLPSRLLAMLPGTAALTTSLRVDDRRFRSAMGWRACASLEQGLQEAARWYQSR